MQSQCSYLSINIQICHLKNTFHAWLHFWHNFDYRKMNHFKSSNTDANCWRWGITWPCIRGRWESSALSITQASCLQIYRDSDYQREFTVIFNEIIARMSQSLGISVKYHCTYCPQPAGFVERANQTIQNQLKQKRIGFIGSDGPPAPISTWWGHNLTCKMKDSTWSKTWCRQTKLMETLYFTQTVYRWNLCYTPGISVNRGMGE